MGYNEYAGGIPEWVKRGCYCTGTCSRVRGLVCLLMGSCSVDQFGEFVQHECALWSCNLLNTAEYGNYGFRCVEGST